MLDFEEARRRILEAAVPLESERIPLSMASGRVLAADLVATTSLPGFDYSAMDGYALRASDVSGLVPCELPVSGECRAGSPPGPLRAGSATRIFTGAALPQGADTVVIQEETEPTSAGVRLLTRPRQGDNIRRRGEDLTQGSVALRRGTRLNAFQLGLLAALDEASALVSRRPRVTVLATGDELREPGSPPRAGSVPESNGVAIAALATLAGAEVSTAPRVPDELDTASRAVAELAARADVLVTIGGVSVGDHDVVRRALTQAGAALDFWKVAIKPGKPFTFGRIGSRLILGLPGNPVSAQLTFALFGLPLLRALQGHHSPLPRIRRVVVSHAMEQKPGRLGIYRARLDGGHVELDANQASGAPTSLAQADCLVFLPKEVGACPAGSELDAIAIEDL